jgi:exodeoxyribonuclease VII small subunit
MSTDKELTFEAALARLEQTVAEMEGGQLTLEQSIARFEEGMKLSRFCAEQLDAIERRIELLVRKADGTLDWQPTDLAGTETEVEGK